MDTQKEQRPALFTLPLLLLGLACSAVVWIFFVFQLITFVPEFSAPIRWFWAAYGATCLSGVFFIAFHMFAAVLLDPRKHKKIQ